MHPSVFRPFWTIWGPFLVILGVSEDFDTTQFQVDIRVVRPTFVDDICVFEILGLRRGYRPKFLVYDTDLKLFASPSSRQLPDEDS